MSGYIISGYNTDNITGNQRVVYDYGEDSAAVPDGMTIDVTGKLWVASFYGGEVRCIDPLTGTCKHLYFDG